ncbi:MAG: lysophospholipid acyltransferase family protein [Fimbriimonadaceae bacterium]|nr:lysophospholipid acyltransferase family protein [Fimbriimonadaceae bacterium]
MSSEAKTPAADPPRYARWKRWLVFPIARLYTHWVLGRASGGIGIGPGPIRSERFRAASRGGMLVVANHASGLDPILAQYGFSRPIHFMATHDRFEIPWLARLMRFFHAFPVHRGKGDRAALRRAIRLLQLGEVVGIFPEGGLSEDGTLQPLERGVTMLIRQTGVPVVVCGIAGARAYMGWGEMAVKPARGEITIRYAGPFDFRDVPDGEIIAKLTTSLHELTGEAGKLPA